MLDTTSIAITTSVAELKDSLAFLRRAMDPRASFPALGGILVREGSLRTTNLDVYATVRLEACSVDHPAFIVDFQEVQRIISGADKGALVYMYLEDGTLRVECDGMTSRLATLPAEDFPEPLPSEVTGNVICWNIHQHKLRRILDLTLPCISTEETRYYLNGVFVNSYGGTVSFVTTDGHKLARFEAGYLARPDLQDGAWGGVIIPHKTCTLLQRSLPTKAVDTGEVYMDVFHRGVTFRWENKQVISKVVDGTFPDYWRVIPDQGDFNVSMDTEKALKAVTRLAKVRPGASCCVSTEGTPSFSIRQGDTAHRIDLPAFFGTGEGEQGFDVDYLKLLLGALNSAGASNTLFIAGKSNGPARILSDEVPDLLYVVMPKRI